MDGRQCGRSAGAARRCPGGAVMLKRLKSFIRRTTASLVPPELRKRTPITHYDIARRLPARPVIVEAGAHNGSDTVVLARLRPGAFVHAFEPVPRLFQELTR